MPSRRAASAYAGQTRPMVLEATSGLFRQHQPRMDAPPYTHRPGGFARWLKAGYLENRHLFPTEAGTPQAVLSLRRCEYDLRLEELLHQTFRVARVKGQIGKVHLAEVNFVRYADDFIITGRSKEQLENEVRPMVEQFPRERAWSSLPKYLRDPYRSGFDFSTQHPLRRIRSMPCLPRKTRTRSWRKSGRHFAPSTAKQAT